MIKNDFKNELETPCLEYWWNFRKKTLSFEGTLKELLEFHKIKYTIKRTENKGIYEYGFKSQHSLSFRERGTIADFRYSAKRFVQMELVRMGDKSTLYVFGAFRPSVTVNH